MRTHSKDLSVLVAGAAAALAVAGCGGSGHSAPRSATTSAPAVSAGSATSPTAAATSPTAGATSPTAAATSPTAGATSPTAAAAARPPRLRIIAPRPGAAASPTLTVRLSLSGADGSGPRAFRYVLDGTLVRLGSASLAFHGLAFGHHQLTVMLASQRSVMATRSFVVPAPVPVTPSPTAATTASPPPITAPVSPPAPSSSNGIPQGPNAGDADGDNHGRASDGDGNV